MKRLSILLLILTILFSLCACGIGGGETPKGPPSGGENPPNPPAENPPENPSTPPDEDGEKNALAIIRELAQKTYEKIVIEIQNTAYDFTLNSRYEIEKDTVTYSIERLNLLPEDGDISNISGDFKNVILGTAAIQNGVITHMDGTPIELPAISELRGDFCFDESNLTLICEEETLISAKVINPDAFFGRETGCTNMTIKVSFTHDAIREILLEYNLGASRVCTKYIFE